MNLIQFYIKHLVEEEFFQNLFRKENLVLEETVTDCYGFSNNLRASK